MRRGLAVIILVLSLVLAHAASAQVVGGGQAPRTAPTPAEIAAQASFDTGTLLALYMARLAAAGTPPTQADIDEAAREYFINGAAVMGVPASGPGAAYFHDGAAVTAYSPLGVTPAPRVTSQADAGVIENASQQGHPGIAGNGGGGGEVTPGAPTLPPVSASPAPAGVSAATGLTCSPREIQAAMALASQFAVPASPSPATTSCPPSPSATFVPLPVEMASTPASGPTVFCPPSPSPWSRFAYALGGALFTGLVFALWSRSGSWRGQR